MISGLARGRRSIVPHRFWPARAAARLVTSQGGFSIVDLIAAIGVSAFVVVAGMTFYAGTLRSARGTSSLAGLQRDAALACELISRDVRDGSSVSIVSDARPGSDSLNVFLRVGTADSLIARYYLDDQGRMLDIAGVPLVTNIDSLQFFTTDGTLVSAAVYLRDPMGSADESEDDQRVLMEASASCRNF